LYLHAPEDGEKCGLSHEWEKLWHPEIEEPEVVFPGYISPNLSPQFVGIQNVYLRWRGFCNPVMRQDCLLIGYETELFAGFCNSQAVVVRISHE
jgi:hypothetical protein